MSPISITAPSLGLRGGRSASTEPLQRVAVIAVTGSDLLRSHGGLIGGIRARRHGVLTLALRYSERAEAGLDAMGVERALLPPQTEGMQLFAQRRWVNTLASQLAAYRPHSVIISGGTLGREIAKAARKARVGKIVVFVPAVPPQGSADAALRALSRTLQLADLAVFHNACDPKTSKTRGLLPADLPYVIVPGGGVDLAYHSAQPLPGVNDGLVFLMTARLDRTKGVLDYCQAARIVKARAPSVRCLLAGPPGEGAHALSSADLAAFADCVTYLGALDDVRPSLGACHVFVYPSLIEGMPRSVLEAMAVGRPIITTDSPGCRDTVDERINGCLVPPSDPAALAAAMETFLKRPDLIPSLARASRAKAERRFDEQMVTATLMNVLGLSSGLSDLD